MYKYSLHTGVYLDSVFMIFINFLFFAQVSISKSKEMPASMQLDAVDAFNQAYTHLSSSSDRCSIVRQIFTEKYPNYKWQVAMYKSYSIQSIKSIDIKVNDDKFILFATKK